MLIGIAPVISPKLLDTLFCMGHGDEIVLADSFFPGHSPKKINNPTLMQGIKPLNINNLT